MKTTLLVIACLAHPVAAAPFQAPPVVPPPPAASDGSHDFDFAAGAWKEHTWRLDKPLTGSTTWFEMDGYSVARKALDGRASIVEYEGEGPRGHLTLLAVRLYDPASHQWSLNFSTPERGALWPTPLVGQFRAGRGDFYSNDEIDGRTILVRFSAMALSPTTARTEQAFSADGGKTWETNWINAYTRIDEPAVAHLAATRPARTGPHDFDFDVGSSKVQIRRLTKPLSGSTTWATYSGTHTVHELWNGRAQLVELVAEGPAGRLEGLGLRLYDPSARQWNLNWVSTGTGTFGAPTIGEFKQGRGEMFDSEPFEGRMILVRNVFSEITKTSSRFEQAFSRDGGKTWEVNWIATATH